MMNNVMVKILVLSWLVEIGVPAWAQETSGPCYLCPVQQIDDNTTGTSATTGLLSGSAGLSYKVFYSPTLPAINNAIFGQANGAGPTTPQLVGPDSLLWLFKWIIYLVIFFMFLLFGLKLLRRGFGYSDNWTSEGKEEWISAYHNDNPKAPMTDAEWQQAYYDEQAEDEAQEDKMQRWEEDLQEMVREHDEDLSDEF